MLISDKTDIFDLTCASSILEGPWSEEEESKLLHAMEELAKEGKTDLSARGCWVSVSKALGATRTPKQCRNKWCVRCSGRFIMPQLHNFESAGPSHSEARSQMKARHGAGNTRTAIF